MRAPSQGNFWKIEASFASIPMLVQGLTRFENSILSFALSVASITNNISHFHEAVGGLAARVAIPLNVGL